MKKILSVVSILLFLTCCYKGNESKDISLPAEKPPAANLEEQIVSLPEPTNENKDYEASDKEQIPSDNETIFNSITVGSFPDSLETEELSKIVDSVNCFVSGIVNQNKDDWQGLLYENQVKRILVARDQQTARLIDGELLVTDEDFFNYFFASNILYPYLPNVLDDISIILDYEHYPTPIPTPYPQTIKYLSPEEVIKIKDYCFSLSQTNMFNEIHLISDNEFVFTICDYTSDVYGFFAFFHKKDNEYKLESIIDLNYG